MSEPLWDQYGNIILRHYEYSHDEETGEQREEIWNWNQQTEEYVQQLTTDGPFQLLSAEELCLLPPPDWLIHGWIPKGGFIGLYGPSGGGKSFIALDMALSVAAHQPWQGHETHWAGLVVYVVAEGGGGTGKRVAAWFQHHQREVDSSRIGFLLRAVLLRPDGADFTTLCERLNELREEKGLPIALVVLDTLARCFEGDENQAEAMGTFVKGVDHLRDYYGAAVLVVHHTPKDKPSIERGSGAFKGATDTMILVHRTGHSFSDPITVTNTKQKDDADQPELELRLQHVAGLNSCVVVRAAIAAKKEVLEPPKPLSRQQAIRQVQKQRWLKPVDQARELSRLLGNPLNTCRAWLRQASTKKDIT